MLRRGVQSISELINVTGFINLDFADVTSIMMQSGLAHMGIGSATGKDKAEEAAKAAISSPLLETSIKGATVYDIIAPKGGRVLCKSDFGMKVFAWRS